jgi:hypothetical protein
MNPPKTNFSLHRTMVGDDHMLHVVGVIHFDDLLNEQSKKDIETLLDIIKRYNKGNTIDA